MTKNLFSTENLAEEIKAPEDANALLQRRKAKNQEVEDAAKAPYDAYFDDIADRGEKQIDLKNMASILLNEVISPLSAYISSTKMADKEAATKMKVAATAYQEDLESRRAALQIKISSLNGLIEKSGEKAKDAVEALGAAICSDDSDAEEAAKKDVDNASMEEYMARRRLDALSKVRITGNDELYFDVIEKYKLMIATSRETATKMTFLIEFADEMINRIKEIRDSADQYRDHMGSGAYDRVRMRSAWSVIESHCGKPVDFTYATAGDEDDCKIRYLNALAMRENDLAFMNSPAGIRLAIDIDDIIAHEERKSTQ